MKNWLILLFFVSIVLSGCNPDSTLGGDAMEIAITHPEIREATAGKDDVVFTAELVCNPEFEILAYIDPLYAPLYDSLPEECLEEEKNWAVYTNWIEDNGMPAGIGVVIDAKTKEVVKVVRN